MFDEILHLMRNLIGKTKLMSHQFEQNVGDDHIFNFRLRILYLKKLKNCEMCNYFTFFCISLLFCTVISIRKKG